MHHRIDSAKRLEQRGMVRDVSHSRADSIDESAVAGREIVIDNHLVARGEELSYGMRSDVSSASGHQHFHVAILLSPVTIESRGRSPVNLLFGGLHDFAAFLAAYYH